MKALSVRQPWAWLIVNGFKDIENRDWYISMRGKIWIHAAKACTKREYNDACNFARRIDSRIIIPALEDLPRGGIVGAVVILDCSTKIFVKSPWFTGFYGAILSDAQPCEFRPLKGQLGFFNVPDVPDDSLPTRFPVDLEALHDPDFSDGLTSVEHLDVLRGGPDPRRAGRLPLTLPPTTTTETTDD